MGLDSALDHAWEVGKKWFKRLWLFALLITIIVWGDKMVDWTAKAASKLSRGIRGLDIATDSLQHDIKNIKKKAEELGGR